MRLQRAVPDLTVADVPAAVGACSAGLRLTVLMDHGWIATPGTPDGRAQLSVMREDLTAPVNPALPLEVDDVDTAYAAARDEGLEIVHPLTDEPRGVRRFFFRDADGALANVLSHLG